MPVPTPSSDDAFAEVKAKVDLIKVVQEHVRLTKRNKDFWGLCPFHQEDSPSFKVNPQMQSWYCFGCERSGDVFTFVELIEKTDKRGALQLLAERAGVELKKLSPEQKERSDSRRRLLAMLKLAAQFYEYVLWSSPAGEKGRRLLEARMVSEETARRFQLGYAPAGRGFAEYLRAKKKSLQDAHDAGLMRSDGTDFFAERLVIPIRDERGQPLAFTARTVRPDEQRKYINSRETAAYIKGRVIFGLDLARDEITKRGHAVLMEGQFDVITAHHHGVTNAVASSGTALTDDQVRLLKRFTDELLLVFDAGLNPGNPNQLELAASRAREVLEKIPDAAVRDTYRERAAGWIGVQPHLLTAQASPSPTKRERFGERGGTESNGKGGLAPRLGGKKLTVGRYLLQLLAVRPIAFDRVRTMLTPDELDEGDRGIYVRMLETYERGGVSGLESELAGYPPEEQDLIRRAWAAPPPSVDDEVAVGLAERIRLGHMRARHSGIIRELSEAERGKDSELVARLEAQAAELARAINEIERRN